MYLSMIIKHGQRHNIASYDKKCSVTLEAPSGAQFMIPIDDLQQHKLTLKRLSGEAEKTDQLTDAASTTLWHRCVREAGLVSALHEAHVSSSAACMGKLEVLLNSTGRPTTIIAKKDCVRYAIRFYPLTVAFEWKEETAQTKQLSTAWRKMTDNMSLIRHSYKFQSPVPRPPERKRALRGVMSSAQGTVMAIAWRFFLY